MRPSQEKTLTVGKARVLEFLQSGLYGRYTVLRHLPFYISSELTIAQTYISWRSIDESIERFREVTDAAKYHGIPVRGYGEFVTSTLLLLS